MGQRSRYTLGRIHPALALALPAALFASVACGSVPTDSAQAPPPSTVAVGSTETPPPRVTGSLGVTPGATQQPASTTPADAEWLPAAPPRYHAGDPIVLNEIHMADANKGWGLGGAGVLVTEDGGQTWRETTPPQVLSSRGTAQAYGSFADAENAWVVFTQNGLLDPETTVWRTSDAGRTWSPSAPLSPQVVGEQTWAELAAADSQHLWLMARGVYAGAGTHYSHELFRSDDGGATWISLDGETSDDFTGMAFADGDHGLLTWQTVGAYAEAPPEYAVTSDGGANWETRALPPPPNLPDLFAQYPYCESYQPMMPSARSIRLLVGCFDYHDPPQDYVSFGYASDDGGTTWGMTALPKDVIASQAQSIYFDEAAVLLLGREILSSSDGGASWSHVKTVAWDGQFSFVDSLGGWAVATSGDEVALVRTVDGGHTWAEIKPKIAG